MPLSRYISGIDIDTVPDVAVKVVAYAVCVGSRRPTVIPIKLMESVSRARSVLNKSIVRDVVWLIGKVQTGFIASSECPIESVTDMNENLTEPARIFGAGRPV